MLQNLMSVIGALSTNKFRPYWTVTGTYGDIDELIGRDFDGLRESIITMLSGNRVSVEVDNGINDLQTFTDKEQVITALIHLGYCAYDEKTQEAYIPDKEIYAVFYKSVKKSSNDGLSQFMRLSDKILDAVSIAYHDENSLFCTVMIALISAFSSYHRPIRVFSAGKGFADLVYLPRTNQPGCPVLVVELKWDKSADTAISQIKRRQYPVSLKEYEKAFENITGSYPACKRLG